MVFVRNVKSSELNDDVLTVFIPPLKSIWTHLKKEGRGTFQMSENKVAERRIAIYPVASRGEIFGGLPVGRAFLKLRLY